MDNAVALVRAYLHVNGYFTVCEYPVLEAARRGAYRMVTDLDVLAVRFPGAGRLVAGLPDNKDSPSGHFEPDPALGVPGTEVDMLIAEVKEGRARLNEAAIDAGVLETALVRFGCCEPGAAPALTQALLRRGHATAAHGHRIRLLIFAPAQAHGVQAGVRVVPLGHVVRFLQEHLEQYWDVLHHAQVKDPAFGFLMTLQKALHQLPSSVLESAHGSSPS